MVAETSEPRQNKALQPTSYSPFVPHSLSAAAEFGRCVAARGASVGQSCKIALVVAPIMEITIVVIVALVAWFAFQARPRRKPEPGFKFVYVNQDGSVRELSPGEQAYLSEEFSGGDSGRPYIKSNYKSSDGWGSQSGFIERRQVPADIPILPVHPNYDALEKELGHDMLGSHRAAGDIIEKNADGSITCKPNPHISHEERFELSRQYQLEEQRRREALAKIDVTEHPE